MLCCAVLWGPDTVLWQQQHTAAGHNNQQHSLLTSRWDNDLGLANLSRLLRCYNLAKDQGRMQSTLDPDTVLLLD